MQQVQDAKNLIDVGNTTTETISVPLREAIGFALAGDIISPLDFPSFAQSAMDGYGVMLLDEPYDRRFKVVAEQQAGRLLDVDAINPGEAVRIFTGAKIPAGVNTVVQQEWVDKQQDCVVIGDFPLKKGLNIRPPGSQTRAGETVLTTGTELNPAAIALLAGLGFEQVECRRKPRVQIINTGRELVAPGNPLVGSQIYESNSYALASALRQMHLIADEIIWVDDEREQLRGTVHDSLSRCDILLITGGVSVGDYDFVAGVLEELGVGKIFHGVAQKPGKPLFYGKKENIPVFGLPGNPASVLTCFYQYVFPLLRKMMGFSSHELTQLYLPCIDGYKKKPGLTHFLKGRLQAEGVSILPHQESYKMNTYALADVLVEIPADCMLIKPNDQVKVYLLRL